MVIRWKIIHGVFRNSQLRDVLGNSQSHEVLTIFTEQAIHAKNTSFAENLPPGKKYFIRTESPHRAK